MFTIYPAGSFNGNYAPQGDVGNADCVIGNEFATPTSDNRYGPVNDALAHFIAEKSLITLPLLLNRNIASALKEINPEVDPDLIFEGESINTTGTKGEGTFGELLQAKEYMNVNGFEVPIIVAQAFHVGRVALQARHVGIENVVVLPGLPRDFDPKSDQPWTRNRGLWSLRELAGVPVLKHRGQI